MEDSFIESTYTIVIERLLYLFSTRLNWERAKFDDEFEEIFSFLIANQIADSTEKSSQLKFIIYNLSNFFLFFSDGLLLRLNSVDDNIRLAALTVFKHLITSSLDQVKKLLDCYS